MLAFLATTAILSGIQYFVFSELRRYLRAYFPQKAQKYVPRFRWFFILMNIPIVFLFFRRVITPDLASLANVAIYPFTVWVFLMLLWAVILFGVVLVRVIRIMRSIRKV